MGVGVEQQLLFKPGWVVLHATDGFVVDRDALAGQLLADQQAPDESSLKPRKTEIFRQR